MNNKFFDSYGNEVTHGTKIIIEHNYNYRHLNNKEAIVKWDKKHGMYKYNLLDDLKGFGDNFYGIHKFKVI